MQFLQSIPNQWASPISMIIVVFGSILLLYPLIWKLTIQQLNAALKAIESAKQLPDVASKLVDLSGNLADIQRGFADLEAKLPDFNEWTEKFGQLSRYAEDLQKKIDSLPPEPLPTENGNSTPNQSDNWGSISENWQKIKDHVEQLIADMDGRRRRKYDTLTRYTYDTVASLLVTDGKISSSQSVSLNEADAQFRSLRNRRLPVTDAIKQNFDRWTAEIVDASAA